MARTRGPSRRMSSPSTPTRDTRCRRSTTDRGWSSQGQEQTGTRRGDGGSAPSRHYNRVEIPWCGPDRPGRGLNQLDRSSAQGLAAPPDESHGGGSSDLEGGWCESAGFQQRLGRANSLARRSTRQTMKLSRGKEPPIYSSHAASRGKVSRRKKLRGSWREGLIDDFSSWGTERASPTRTKRYAMS